MDRPHLRSQILHGLANKIAANCRATQKRLERNFGAQSYREVFSLTDQALALIKLELDALDSQMAGSSGDAPVGASMQHDNSGQQEPNDSKSFYDLLKQEIRQDLADAGSSDGVCSASDGMRSEMTSVSSVPCDQQTTHLTEAEVEALVDDRLTCIKPFLKHEMNRANDLMGSLPPAPHGAKLVRDVAAHVRRRDVHIKVSSLDEPSLKHIQRGARKRDDTRAEKDCFSQRFEQALKQVDAGLPSINSCQHVPTAISQQQLEWLAGSICERMRDELGAHSQLDAIRGRLEGLAYSLDKSSLMFARAPTLECGVQSELGTKSLTVDNASQTGGLVLVEASTQATVAVQTEQAQRVESMLRTFAEQMEDLQHSLASRCEVLHDSVTRLGSALDRQTAQSHSSDQQLTLHILAKLDSLAAEVKHVVDREGLQGLPQLLLDLSSLLKLQMNHGQPQALTVQRPSACDKGISCSSDAGELHSADVGIQAEPIPGEHGTDFGTQTLGDLYVSGPSMSDNDTITFRGAISACDAACQTFEPTSSNAVVGTCTGRQRWVDLASDEEAELDASSADDATRQLNSPADGDLSTGCISSEILQAPSLVLGPKVGRAELEKNLENNKQENHIGGYFQKSEQEAENETLAQQGIGIVPIDVVKGHHPGKPPESEFEARSSFSFVSNHLKTPPGPASIRLGSLSQCSASANGKHGVKLHFDTGIALQCEEGQTSYEADRQTQASQIAGPSGSGPKAKAAMKAIPQEATPTFDTKVFDGMRVGGHQDDKGLEPSSDFNKPISKSSYEAFTSFSGAIGPEQAQGPFLTKVATAQSTGMGAVDNAGTELSHTKCAIATDEIPLDDSRQNQRPQSAELLNHTETQQYDFKHDLQIDKGRYHQPGLEGLSDGFLEAPMDSTGSAEPKTQNYLQAPIGGSCFSSDGHLRPHKASFCDVASSLSLEIPGNKALSLGFTAGPNEAGATRAIGAQEVPGSLGASGTLPTWGAAWAAPSGATETVSKVELAELSYLQHDTQQDVQADPVRTGGQEHADTKQGRSEGAADTSVVTALDDDSSVVRSTSTLSSTLECLNGHWNTLAASGIADPSVALHSPPLYKHFSRHMDVMQAAHRPQVVSALMSMYNDEHASIVKPLILKTLIVALQKHTPSKQFLVEILGEITSKASDGCTCLRALHSLLNLLNTAHPAWCGAIEATRLNIPCSEKRRRKPKKGLNTG